MIPVYDINAVRPYTLKADTGEQKTIFHLGNLDPYEEAYLNSEFSKVSYEKKKESGELETLVSIDAANRSIEAVRLKLKDVKNFPALIEFTVKKYPFGERAIVADAFLNKIAPYIQELGREIMNGATFTEQDAKK